MFGIGFFELLLIAIFGLLICGPEKLPEAIRTISRNVGRAKRAWQHTRRELEEELGMDEIRRELYNEQIQEELKRRKKSILGEDGDAESTKEDPSREEKIRKAAIKHEEKLDREDD
ncbi:MAG: Sec-independent protein translocase protein TatB [Pseudomonadales bacterium]